MLMISGRQSVYTHQSNYYSDGFYGYRIWSFKVFPREIRKIIQNFFFRHVRG